jgi:hypothetical protein
VLALNSAASTVARVNTTEDVYEVYESDQVPGVRGDGAGGYERDGAGAALILAVLGAWLAVSLYRAWQSDGWRGVATHGVIIVLAPLIAVAALAALAGPGVAAVVTAGAVVAFWLAERRRNP